MIMFTSKSNRIFAQVIDDYHRCDDVDAPVRNPYANGSIEYLLYLKNWIDTVQWHLEDIIRDPNIDPVEALKIKRRIDRSNQERTDMVEYIDDVTQGDTKQVRFFTGEKSDHLYTVAKKWNETGGDYRSDVRNMCRMLSARGLPAADLILGTDVADYILTDEATQRLLDKNSGIITGEIRQQLSKYDGVVLMGTLNFGGFMLTVFSVDETYSDDNGVTKKYFPADAAMVTAPNCGHMMYGSITQMDYGQVNYSTYAAKRVPKFVVDQDKDTRKLRLGCRPLAAPNRNPYIFAANVVG